MADRVPTRLVDLPVSPGIGPLQQQRVVEQLPQPGDIVVDRVPDRLGEPPVSGPVRPLADVHPLGERVVPERRIRATWA